MQERRNAAPLALDTDCRSPDTLPKVIFIEPQFTDGAEPDKADDDHPTTPISRGQDLIRRVYAAVTGNPQLWSKSLLIITYDEHDGFFDHVEPLPLVTPQNHGESYTPFATTGVRVPAILVSPWVQKGTVVHQRADGTERIFEHASIPATVSKWLLPDFNDNDRSPREAAAETFLDLLSLPVMRPDCPEFNL